MYDKKNTIAEKRRESKSGLRGTKLFVYLVARAFLFSYDAILYQVLAFFQFPPPPLSNSILKSLFNVVIMQ